MILTPIKVVMESKKNYFRKRKNFSKSPFEAKQIVPIKDFQSNIIKNRNARSGKSIDIIKKPVPMSYRGYFKKKSFDRERKIYYETPPRNIIVPAYLITPEYLNSIKKVKDSEKKELGPLSFKKTKYNSLPPIPKIPFKIYENVLNSNK